VDQPKPIGVYRIRGEVIGDYSSIGFNPFFHDSQNVVRELSGIHGLMNYAADIQHVYFFGAGCSHPNRNYVIAHGLRKFLPKHTFMLGTI
jgi:hypothetical protein